MAQTPHESTVDRYGVRSAWAHLAMCAATAVLLTLAYPLPGWSFMAWFALVPVGVLAMRTRRLWTLAWTSYVVFFAWWALRVVWLRHVGGIAPFGIAVVCAGYFAVALVVLAVVQRRFNGAMTLMLPLFWCTQEILRSVWPLGGFAWFTLGSSQAAWREGQHPGFIVQTADLFGWVTVSFLVAMTSGLLVDLIARPLTKRRATGALRPRRTIMTAVCLWLACMTGAVVYGYDRLRNTPTLDTPGADIVTLGIVQTNVPQSNKRQGGGEDLLKRKLEDLEAMLELSELSASDDVKPELIVWPETMITFPINDEAYAMARGGKLERLPPDIVLYFRERVQQHVDRVGVPVVVGSQAWGFAHDRTMNSALFAEPGAERWPRYSKMHLVPMGEYIPGPRWFRTFFMENFSPYDYDYTVQPGGGVVVFELDREASLNEAEQAPLRFATPICYEDAVAIQCRKMVYGNDGQKRVDLLLNLTNEGWYLSTHQRYQHMQLAVMRCIENRVPMARSVNTGVSGLIDSSGRIGPVVSVGGSDQEVAGYVNATVMVDPRSSLYGRVREGVWVGLCVTSGLMLLGVAAPRTSGRRGKQG